MGGAELVRWAFAAMFATLTVYYVIRLLVSNPGISTGDCGCDRGVDISRLVMSLGMVVMLVPWIDPLPRLCWQLLFGLAAGYIAVRLIRRVLPTTQFAPVDTMARAHELHLLIGGMAMVYMFAVMPAGSDPGAGVPQDPAGGVSQDPGAQSLAHHMDMTQPGSSGLALNLLTWTLVGYFVVFVVRLAARLAVPVNILAGMAAGAALPGGGPRGVVVSPHLLGSTEVVMGIGMSYMLLTML